MSQDLDALKLAVFTVYSYKQGELVSLMIHLGKRLGLWEALGSGATVTPAELADATGLHERWVREWLFTMASAQLIGHDPATEDDGGPGTYQMSPEMRAVLCDPNHPAYGGGVFAPPTETANVDRLVEAFHTGLGFGWDSHGHATCHMMAEMSAVRHRNFLVPNVIGGIPGLTERLADGARVIDIGCGSGVAACAVAAAFPNCTVLGMDPSTHAIDSARGGAAEAGLDNVSFELGVFDDLPSGGADLLLTMDVVHDLPRPVEAVHAAGRCLTPDGVWVVGDIRAHETFQQNRRIPLVPLLYSMSVMYCMNSSMSEPDGAGIGTLGLHPELFRGWVEGSGLRLVDIYEFDHDVNNRYFEVRP